jgi:hypothetical protein
LIVRPASRKQVDIEKVISFANWHDVDVHQGMQAGTIRLRTKIIERLYGDIEKDLQNLLTAMVDPSRTDEVQLARRSSPNSAVIGKQL